MTLRFTKKHIIIVLFSALVLVGGSYLAIMLLVDPVKAEIGSLESSISTQQKLIDVLKQKQNNNETPVVSSTEIQKKVPVIPLVEQLILDIQQAENVSKSEITSMSFAESDFSLPAEIPASQPVTTEPTDSSSQETTEQTESEEEPVVFDPSVVEGLKQVTVTISIESPGYYELEKFLSLIEDQTRIAKIDSLNFTGKSEVVSVAQEDLDEPLSYTVTLSTFYMSAFPELAIEAPKVNYPTPSDKKNPLFVNTSEEDEDEE
ncbi:hypothetical protein [Litchfieldia alkalitelluris]|uniref:hypothetical protein n=1 Tax=Litchfieldia alkalitelluris TaxID=304268 RepID=UPI0009988731|nr:hypothetical protein [Litchfieldia alkalitelluris]